MSASLSKRICVYKVVMFKTSLISHSLNIRLGSQTKLCVLEFTYFNSEQLTKYLDR